jgi:hypothetical protein
VQELADTMSLSGLLEELRASHGHYELLEHWKQGEFHHDVVLETESGALPGKYLVVATNCNGGVKEVLVFDRKPERWALWHHRCPDNPEFEGMLPPILAAARTAHWFDPCELLRPDARSELRPECRIRARGGGWEPL